MEKLSQAYLEVASYEGGNESLTYVLLTEPSFQVWYLLTERLPYSGFLLPCQSYPYDYVRGYSFRQTSYEAIPAPRVVLPGRLGEPVTGAKLL